MVPGGSPADCVVAGMTHLCHDKLPDVVLSGVNNGQNLGDIINCSGTAAGAREGALQGAIGIAISQGVDYERTQTVHWDNARRYGLDVVRQILALPANRDVYWNVNLPYCAPGQVEGIEVVPAAETLSEGLAAFKIDVAPGAPIADLTMAGTKPEVVDTVMGTQAGATVENIADIFNTSITEI